MAIIELAIDIGSSYVTIFQKDKGVIFKEPSIVLAVKRKNKLELLETGKEAEAALSSSLGNAQIINPIREGIVVHQEAAGLMMKAFFKKIIPEKLFVPHVKVYAFISMGLTVVERRAAENMLIKAGAKEVMLVESPCALLAYTNSVGGLFVDIGGGICDVAAATKRGIASGATVNIAGNLFNSKIIDQIADKYSLKIGDFTAEKLKTDIGSMYDNDINGAGISGRDRLNGEPRTIEATAKDVKKALSAPIDNLVDIIRSVLDATPPELSAEIYKKGIFISGGSAKLPGLSEYISVRLGLPVTELTDLTEAVAIGGGRLLDDKALLASMLNTKEA